jgi:hypothetical protein
MNAISGVDLTAGQYQTDTQSPWQHRGKGSNALHGSPKAGNLAGAQKAFVTLQQNRQVSSQTAGARNASGQDDQTSATFQVLQNALKSGSLPEDPQDFASLQQDAQGPGAEETEPPHDGSANNTAQTGSSASSGGAAQTAGHLLDVLA